jgi:hypothetical protein
MALRDRITSHPLNGLITSALDGLAAMPQAVRAQNPDLCDRTTRTLEVLRQRLQVATADITPDQTLMNMQSWVQQLVQEVQNATSNPGSPQFLANMQGPVDAIAQNLHTIPTPDPQLFPALLEEAQSRVSAIQTTQIQAEERARLLFDQINAELQKAKQAADQGIERAQQQEKIANDLLAALGAKGTSSEYLSTSTTEKAIADRWRLLTLCVGVIGAVLTFIAIQELKSDDFKSVAARASITLPFVFLAIYCGRQAAEHRSQERQARSLGLQLGSVSTFVADLDGQARKELKSQLAQRFYGVHEGPGHEAGPEPGAGYPSSRDLVGLLRDVIKKLH